MYLNPFHLTTQSVELVLQLADLLVRKFLDLLPSVRQALLELGQRIALHLDVELAWTVLVDGLALLLQRTAFFLQLPE